MAETSENDDWQEIAKDLKKLGDAGVEASLRDTTAATLPLDCDPHKMASPAVGEGTSAGRRFRILRPHAAGGLGKVSIAHDEELHRDVALKELHDRHANYADSRSRFVLEAEITGGLEHPGIVPVYGLGQYADGRPFYAMRLVRGDSLKQAIEGFHKRDKNFEFKPGERSLELRKLLGRLIDVCNAVEYAHSRGVLHRDLKPGNIMLGGHGETLVVDWGLAKVIGRQGEHQSSNEATLQPNAAGSAACTQMGSAVGTPAYMSPEQAAGRLDNVGPASDVYSLGATLYHLLTGQAPFQGREAGEILGKVQAGYFPKPRRVALEIPKPLEAICLKAMALKPEDRYASPRALADDIERWLADEPVSAYRESVFERSSRAYRRHGVTLALGTCFVVLNLFMVFQLLIAAVRMDAARYGMERELQDGLGRFWDSLFSVTTIPGMLTIVGLPVLAMLVALVMDAGIVWLIMRWRPQRRVSFVRAAAAVLLTTFLAANPRVLELTGWSETAAVVVALVVTAPIVFMLIKQVLHAHFLRTCLVMLAMGASHLAVFAAVYVGGALAFKLLPAEPLKVGGNAMAPTLLGHHHQGTCAVCGDAAFAAHRTEESNPSATPGRQQPACSFCNHGMPHDAALGDETRSGICQSCMRITEISDVDPRPRGFDRLLINKLLSPKRWDLVVFSNPANPKQTWLHRVVGLPGETVTIVDGELRINGTAVAPPGDLGKLRYDLAVGQFQLWGTAMHPAELKADEYFVLGDFSMLSYDSRLWRQGAPNHSAFAVPREYIKGVVTHVYWPLWRYRQLR